MKNSKLTKLFMLFGLTMSLSACSIIDDTIEEGRSQVHSVIDGIFPSDSKEENVGVSSNGEFSETSKELSRIDYKPNMNPVIQVNDGDSTLDPNSWDKSHIEYSEHDRLDRTGPATAFLNKDNYGASEGREGQRYNPSGWNNAPLSIDGKQKRIQDRGHLIAYTLTFNLNDNGDFEQGHLGSIDNPNNLATQSSYSNRVLFQVYEGQVRDAIKSNKEVIYRVEPVFRERELMPRGYWAQAISTDGTLNFNVYIMNIQPGAEFDYSTGISKTNSEMIVPK